MGNVYVLGAGFSKTCGIATDMEMLDSLNPLLEKTPNKDGTITTYIESLLQQNFPGNSKIGFESFMSTLSALKYLPEFMKLRPNIFAQAEKRIRLALNQYMNEAVTRVDWQHEGKVILEFVNQIDWKQDFVITFNYDSLLEGATLRAGSPPSDHVLHLHGSVKDGIIVYPTYKKLASRNARTKLAQRWKKAFEVLRDLRGPERLVFIGYSMPPTDLEARGLFNYTDWYNRDNSRQYKYETVVVNPDGQAQRNYAFFRRPPRLCLENFSTWMESN